MDQINKTLYIPLYGKSFVSKKGLFINDTKAIEIWEKEEFILKGRSKSKWLAYYMGIRAKVFDEYVKVEISNYSNPVIIHLGCGLDSRAIRLSLNNYSWYDIDFPLVIEERKKYYTESLNYHMIGIDIKDNQWINQINNKDEAIIIMEGVSMYLTLEELQKLFYNISNSFSKVSLLVDCYTLLGAKLSRFKNPVKDVGVNKVYGLSEPTLIQNENLVFIKEHVMMPKNYINELKGLEKFIFSVFYAGGLSKKLYKLYEYKKE